MRSRKQKPVRRRRTGGRPTRARVTGDKTPRRRIGAETSATRNVLLDAAERLMVEEGYAAVSSRRVAAAAGVKPALVHYYFRTMDDLFLAVYRRRAEQDLERYTRLLASDRPLRALWEINVDAAGTAFLMEFMALANHRKKIRGEIANYAERFRRMQLDVLSDALRGAGLRADALPPTAVLLAMTGLSQVLVLERALGMTTGHTETIAFVERRLAELERGGSPRS